MADESDIHIVVSEPVPPKETFAETSIFDKAVAEILISLEPDKGTKKMEEEFKPIFSNKLDTLERIEDWCPVVTTILKCLIPDELSLGIPIKEESDTQIVTRLIE